MIESPSRILRTDEVARRVGVTRSTLWRWYNAGHFPRPRLIGPTTSKPLHGWLESTVDAWLDARPSLIDSGSTE